MDDKILQRFAGKIKEILANLDQIQRSARVAGINSPFFGSPPPGSKSVLEENLESIGNLETEFLKHIGENTKSRGMITAYAGQEPVNSSQIPFFNASTKKIPNAILNQLNQSNKLVDEIEQEIQKAKDICFSIQGMVTQSIISTAQLNEQIQEAEKSDSSKEAVRPYLELQGLTELTNKDSIDAIKANLQLGMQNAIVGFQNSDMREVAFEEASKYYVVALRLAKKFNQQSAIEEAINYLAQIGRDENGTALASSSSLGMKFS